MSIRLGINKYHVLIKGVRPLIKTTGIKWVDIINFSCMPESGRQKVKGVYMIGDVYIGASKHIRNRIKQHISACRRSPECCRIELVKYVYCQLSNGLKVDVSFLDKDPFMEKKHYIEKFGFPEYSVMFYDDVYKNKR